MRNAFCVWFKGWVVRRTNETFINESGDCVKVQQVMATMHCQCRVLIRLEYDFRAVSRVQAWNNSDESWQEFSVGVFHVRRWLRIFLERFVFALEMVQRCNVQVVVVVQSTHLSHDDPHFASILIHGIPLKNRKRWIMFEAMDGMNEWNEKMWKLSNDSQQQQLSILAAKFWWKTNLHKYN